MKKLLKKQYLKKIIAVLLCACLIMIIGFEYRTYKAKADTNLEVLVYNYTGEMQYFTAPRDGLYRLEAWGAEGGFANDIGGYGEAHDTSGSSRGGLGGYTSGYIKLKKDQTIYICVGGYGTWSNYGSILSYGGYNGGGDGGVRRWNDGDEDDEDWKTRYFCGGGGCTSITFNNNGVLSNGYNDSDIIMVAGGGGGYAGTEDKSQMYKCEGGQNNSAFLNSMLGKGTNGEINTESAGAGGGGGYRGGNMQNAKNGYGGSSYINLSVLTETLTEAGAKSGAGMVRITYGKDAIGTLIRDGNGVTSGTLKKTDKLYVSGMGGATEFNVTRTDNFLYPESAKHIEYTVPYTGYYLLEAWGASGEGDYATDAGRGGYISSSVYLEKGQKLYIELGGHGISNNTPYGHLLSGGYNGGGNAGWDNNSGGGGGCTSITLTNNGELKNGYNDSDILLVAGGGGGGSIGGCNNYISEDTAINLGHGGWIYNSAYDYCVNLNNKGFGQDHTDESENLVDGSGGGGGYYGGKCRDGDSPGYGGTSFCGSSCESKLIQCIVGFNRGDGKARITPFSVDSVNGVMPWTPQRDGYEFIGWDTDKNSANPIYEPNLNPHFSEIIQMIKNSDNKELTLYAIWKENGYKIFYNKGLTSE